MNKFTLLSGVLGGMFAYAVTQISDSFVMNIFLIVPVVFCIGVCSHVLWCIFTGKK